MMETDQVSEANHGPGTGQVIQTSHVHENQEEEGANGDDPWTLVSPGLDSDSVIQLLLLLPSSQINLVPIPIRHATQSTIQICRR